MNWLIIDKIIREALEEDISYGDITTNSIVDSKSRSDIDLLAKEEGIIAGLEVFKRVFQILGEVDVKFFVIDGDRVNKGQLIGKITGSTRNILTGERTALNILQRLSGIATLTGEFVEKLNGTNTKLLDTRKTTPNMRMLEKYAVLVGGGSNHRFNLSDGILIKDNHIDAAGGIKNAVEKVRKTAPFVRKVEVETETLEEVQEALDAKADIIMLDNMSIETVKKAISLINKRATTEISGNITLGNIEAVAHTGVDYISTGAVTHSYKVLDLSMKNLKNL